MANFTSAEKRINNIRNGYNATLKRRFGLSEVARIGNTHYYLDEQGPCYKVGVLGESYSLAIEFNKAYSDFMICNDASKDEMYYDFKGEILKALTERPDPKTNKERKKKKSNGGYHKLQRYGIEEVHELIAEAKKKEISHIEVNGYPVKVYSHRYWNFMEHGTKCVTCGLEGTHYWLETSQRDSKGNPIGFHFNLYAENGVMITKDHIIPKSKGGKNYIGNYQPMCGPCNWAKGNKLEKEAV